MSNSSENYTPDLSEVRDIYVDDRISRDPSRYPHAEAHVPEVQEEFDRFIHQVRQDAWEEFSSDRIYYENPEPMEAP